jgi:hypothetical protein
MRISCHTIADFKKNLEGESVFLETVYEESSKIVENEDTGKCDVYYKLSAVIDFGENGQALVQSGELCGTDRPVSDEFDGSERLEELRETVHSWAAGNHWKVKPGVLDI